MTLKFRIQYVMVNECLKKNIMLLEKEELLECLIIGQSVKSLFLDFLDLNIKDLKQNSETYIAIPPGETIKEQLEDRDMSQKEFARRMDLSEKHVSRLLNGKVGLTHDTALKLESVLGIKAEFWNNLENRYREKLALVKSENEMEKS